MNREELYKKLENILLNNEDNLSDGFSFYGGDKSVKKMLNEMVEVVLLLYSNIEKKNLINNG